MNRAVGKDHPAAGHVQFPGRRDRYGSIELDGSFERNVLESASLEAVHGDVSSSVGSNRLAVGAEDGLADSASLRHHEAALRDRQCGGRGRIAAAILGRIKRGVNLKSSSHRRRLKRQPSGNCASGSTRSRTIAARGRPSRRR